jgi:GT2 family glycosyltransferase
MVSLMVCTYGRPLTTQSVGRNMEKAGYPLELLVVDNGSVNPKVVQYIKTLSPAYLRVEATNVGIAHGYNHMLDAAKGDHFCIIDNDMDLPEDWLAALLNCYNAIPNSGIAGICFREQGVALNPLTMIGSQYIHPEHNCVLGVKFFSRRIFDRVGYMNEELDPYAFVDCDYHYRVEKSGFTSYYIGGMTAGHIFAGEDAPEYRTNKDTLINEARPKFFAAKQRYDQSGNYQIKKKKQYGALA